MIGGAADDLFIFSANGVQFANGNGTLDGNGGVNTIDYAAYTNPVSVNLALGTATGTSGISNFRDVIGGSGGDTLIGDGQDNILRGNGGNDSIDGGAGVDTLDESNAAVSINVDLSTTAPQNSGRGTVTYQNLEYVLTGSGNDLITSSSANNILRGGAGDDTYRFKDGWGADTVVDTAGSDTIDFVLANNGVTFNPASSEVVNGANNVTYLGIESLAGSSGDDTFNIVGALTHTLRGGAGNDAFVFADGATLTGTVDGQSGTDTLNFSNLQSPISVALTSVGSTDGFNGTDAAISGGFSNVDNLIGTSGSDTLNVSTATNTWKFEVGNLKLEVGSNSLTFSNFDTLNGSTGADTFAFADGADFVGTIDGKGGTDTLDFSAYLTGRNVVLTSVGVVDGFNLTVANISATFLNINTLIGSSATDSLTGLTSGAWAINGITNTYLQTNTLAFSAIENLIGGSGADTFAFANGATLENGNGTLNGGGGTDVIDYAAYLVGVIVNLATGSATGTNGISNIENVIGGAGADDITSDSNNNELTGNGGDDIFRFLSGWGETSSTSWRAVARMRSTSHRCQLRSRLPSVLQASRFLTIRTR